MSEPSRTWISRAHRVHVRNIQHCVFYVMGLDKATEYALECVSDGTAYVAVFTPRGVALREWYNGTEKPKVQPNGDEPPF